MQAAIKGPLLFRSRSNTSAGTARRLGLTRPIPARCKLPCKGTLAYAASRLPGGKYTFMEYARWCEDEGIKAVVHRWDSLSKYDQRRVSLEELCDAVGIRYGKLLGSVVEAAYEYNMDVSNLVAATMHPEVVQASIDRALETKGVEDRRMQFQHSGFLPMPRGPAIAVFNAVRVTKPHDDRELTPLPDFEEQAIEASKIAREEDAIEGPSASATNKDS